MGAPFHPEKRAAIIAEIRMGLPYPEICAHFNVSKNAVSKMAIKAGLRRGERSRMLDPDQEADIAARYTAGEKTVEIAVDLGISPDLVWSSLARTGTAARGMGPVPMPLRHDALDELTPDAAYWLGIFFTDGTVTSWANRSDEVAVVLKRSDRGHLVKLRDFLGSEHAITPIAPARVSPQYAAPNGGQGTGAFRYSFRSQRLADRVLDLGRYGPAVNPALAASRDFWRGCVDGDGTLGISCGVPQAKLFGSQWLLSAFVDFLGPVSSWRPLNVRPSKSIFVVSTSYQTAVKVTRRLYSGASTGLDRKMAVAERIMRM
jgi:hypothetical protein